MFLSLIISEAAVIMLTAVNTNVVYYAPANIGEGHYKIGVARCLSVRPSVRPVPRPNSTYSRTERHVSLDRVAEINKKAAWYLCNGVWMTHYDINKVKVISELLCIRHSYVNLDCFNSEDIDFMIEFMCTD